MSDALDLFHPEIRLWFRETYGEPTEIQALAWPAIASGRHLLLVAPTGSGKTLCAFLWALNQLLTGAWTAGATRVLYVSPLKALNNDIRRNLVHPLREIRRRLVGEADGGPPASPDITIMTRSGDTPAEERRRMLRRPPEILITTPESLNLLVSSPRARETLTGIRTVIVDEVHAVASTRRGTHLFTAVERLVPLAGEFQRLALSATVRPPEVVAQLVGGFRLAARGPEPAYERREVTVLESRLAKQVQLQVRFPAAAEADPGAPPGQGGEAFWLKLVAQILPRIRANRSTLIFTNTRRHAEKLARLVNEQAGAIVAYAHHGSLSKELRLVVESRLKAGQLEAIVATSSLELGIDIGELDEVLLVQTPSSVSSALQRIGRSGHAVGAVSRGTLFALHGLDLLQAALTARAVADLEIEEVHPVHNPLDLLAQIILSMTGLERWDLQELYNALRTTVAYHELPRRHFDLVVEMLAGRYAEVRLRELEPRVSLDRLENTIQGRRSALPLVYRAGGTIPDRGAYALCALSALRSPSGVEGPAGRRLIGELDEEFVWERRVGDTFNLGTQNWKIARIDARSVEVVPWDGPVTITPFWRAERPNRDFRSSERIALALERWSSRLGDPALPGELQQRHSLDEQAAAALVEFLRRQRAATGGELPHRHHLLIEHTGGASAEASARASARRLILHTLWGGQVNQPLALALRGAWEREGGAPIEIEADNECLMLLLPETEGFDPKRLLGRVSPQDLEGLLRQSLQASGLFAARFRESAGRALLLPRSDPRRRVPLWLTRLRSKRLLEAVSRFPDFPIVLEAWRACLEEEFDLPALRGVLEELQRGEIRISEARTASPSPFAANSGWLQSNRLVYEQDAVGPRGARGGAAAETLRELLQSARLRPRLEPRLVRELTAKLHRTAPGYAPAGADELMDLVKERLVLPRREWDELLGAVRRDHGITPEELLAACGHKLLALRLPAAVEEAVVALECVPRLLRALGEASGVEPSRLDVEVLPRPGLSGDLRRAPTARRPDGPEESSALGLLLNEWLRSYGPVELAMLQGLFGLSAESLREALDDSLKAGSLVLDSLSSGGGFELCDAENLEILLRLTRRGLRPAFRALPLERLPVFLGQHHRLTPPTGESRTDSLREALETLFGYPAPARLWEEEILPARLSPYFTAWLDGLLRESELQWLGCGPRELTFCFTSDLELFAPEPDPSPALSEDLRRLLPALRGRFGYWDLVDHSGLAPAEVTRLLWRLAWAGVLTCDSLAGLRAESWAESDARPAPRNGSRASRVGFDRWRAAHPLAGNWRALREVIGVATDATDATDALDQQELDRERVRQLLRRHGILFRELLAREMPPLRWGAVFRTLRIMELSGEVVSGQFFDGIPGPQFMSHAAFRHLERGLEDPKAFWVCAADPASPCGLGLELGALPPRLPANHLLYGEGRLVLVSRGRGRHLEFPAGPDDAARSCGAGVPRLFTDHLRRDFRPWKSVVVQTVNGEAVRDSPYKELLKSWGFVEEYRGLVLRARP